MGCLKLTNYKQKLPRRWISTVKFFYKDYTLIEESTASNDVLKEFVWDPTAGQATKPLYMRVPQTGSNLLYLHDANKNVTEVSYLATANGIGAHYEYDSFGNTITSTRNTRVSSPDLRTYNPFRFSSEYHDDELSLIYYNYRHYNPQSGRWISRDPIGEEGGYNLYVIIGNNLINYFDVLGLQISIGGRNVSTPWGYTGSNHTFIALTLTKEQLDVLSNGKCCPGVSDIQSIFLPTNGSFQLLLGGFESKDGFLDYQENNEVDITALNETTKWWKPDWDVETKKIQIPENKNELKVICDLLTAGRNYNRQRITYTWYSQNCTNFVKSIFEALGISVDVDFNGVDWDSGKSIPKIKFEPPVPPNPNKKSSSEIKNNDKERI